jgi:hypothetical protein
MRFPDRVYHGGLLPVDRRGSGNSGCASNTAPGPLMPAGLGETARNQGGKRIGLAKSRNAPAGPSRRDVSSASVRLSDSSIGKLFFETRRLKAGRGRA